MHIFFKKERTFQVDKEKKVRVAWVAQSVKCLILDFGSGHDLTGHESEPCVGLCADSAEPAWDSLSPSLSAPPPALVYPRFLFLSQNK